MSIVKTVSPSLQFAELQTLVLLSGTNELSRTEIKRRDELREKIWG